MCKYSRYKHWKIQNSVCWTKTLRKQQVTYNLKFNGLSIQLYGSYFEVYANCANVTFCVCVILQREKYRHLEDTLNTSPSLMHIHFPECVAEKNVGILICLGSVTFHESTLPGVLLRVLFTDSTIKYFYLHKKTNSKQLQEMGKSI